MDTRLTVIVDNISGSDLKGEWGLSILAEHSGKQILVDAGGSELFAEDHIAALEAWQNGVRFPLFTENEYKK